MQALVDAGSPRASTVLRSLIAYLRAAVPLLHEPTTTIEREVQLVRPYLELMQMRMPDRLRFALHVDASALRLRCPPTTLLTLVENAVRHGIDPSEEGGSIDIEVRRRGDRCVIRVTDTGVGLRQTDQGLGTGLTTLRERLQLMFGDDAQLRVSALEPRGVVPSSRSRRARRRVDGSCTRRHSSPTTNRCCARPSRCSWRRSGPSSRSSRRRATAARRSTCSRAMQPDVCFLDVHMPGLSGLDAANQIGRRAHLVFVTAYDHYAVQAFAQGALDYLLKPVEPARLAETVSRLKERLQSSRPAVNTEELLQQLTAQLAGLQRAGAPAALRWIRAQVAADPAPDRGGRGRLLPLRREVHRRRLARARPDSPPRRSSDCRSRSSSRSSTRSSSSQVHRSVVVNLRAISHVVRHDNDTAEIHLKGRKEVLPVSRSYLHLFRQM